MKRRRYRPLTEFQLYVCRQQCCVCAHLGKQQRSDTRAHHEPPKGRVGKDHDDVVPLCYGHHRERHHYGVETFWRRYPVDWCALIADLRAKFEAQADDERLDF